MNNKPVAYITMSGLSYQQTGLNDRPLYTHPVKELHLSLQKEKETGELLAVTYTDDEHRIVEVLWKRPPVKEQGNPVAWRSQSPDGYWSLYGAPVEGAEPLYTGFKQLTDKDEVNLIKDAEQFGHSEVYITGLIDGFNHARTVLEKAQKK